MADEAPLRTPDGTVEAAISHLDRWGYAILDGLIPDALTERLAARLMALEADDALAAAGIGRATGHKIEPAIRIAQIRWLDGEDSAERELLDLAEWMRLAINRRLFLGLFDFECHFISYPVGGFYGRHIDSLAGPRNRVVSFVMYLDPDWLPEHGGGLELWALPTDEGPPVVAILPHAGRAVLLLSEQVPHGVQPTLRPRHAIAGWWRVASA